MSYLAALDAGASQIKASIFDSAGHELANARRDYRSESPFPGWAECSPHILMEWPLEVLKEAIASSGIEGDDIAAIGITGSSGTVLPIDGDGNAAGPVILWYDRRAQAVAEELAERLSRDRFAELTGVPLDHVPAVSKILWLRAERPRIYASAAVFAQPQTAILHALTDSGWYCDYTYGSYVGLMDLEVRCWNDELLTAAGLSEHVLPRLVAPGTVVGTPSRSSGRETGLGRQTKVVASGADATCFTLGAGVEGTGTASVYIGTAGVVGVVTERPVRDRRLTCSPSALPGHWDVQGLLLTGGSAYQWARDLLSDSAGHRGALSFEDMNVMAARVPAGSEGVIVIPHLAGAGTPLWNPQASGTVLGLRLSHGPAHLARAVLEGIAFAERHALEALQEVVSPIRNLRLSGGGCGSELWAQIVADVTGLPVSVPVCSESTSLGAAIVAGVAAGMFPDFNAAVNAMSRTGKQYDPDGTRNACYEAGYRSYLCAVSRMEYGMSVDEEELQQEHGKPTPY